VNRRSDTPIREELSLFELSVSKMIRAKVIASLLLLVLPPEKLREPDNFFHRLRELGRSRQR